MLGVTTKTDVATSEWLKSAEVLRLREWASDRNHMLSPFDEYVIGSSESCSLRLDDEAVSRVHARLARDQEKWLITDLGSTNGLLLDGVPCNKFVVESGVEIGIGGVTLIAESGHWIELRGFLSRILGWRDRTAIVDSALRAIRKAAACRNELVLCCESDPVPLAQALHRHTLGSERPFVVCDPLRRDSGESARSAANHSAGMDALRAAAGGTLCVRAARLPLDFNEVLVRVREPQARTQLVVCTQTAKECKAFVSVPIQVPSLSARKSELERIVDEYAQDAIAALGVPSACFVRSDRTWVLKRAVSSLSEIETTTLRLVALRASPNVAQAAERLGMTSAALSRWIKYRKLRTHVPL